MVDLSHDRFEYIDAGSNDAFMDSIDPSLVRLGDRLHQKQRHITAQVETVYEDQTDTPARTSDIHPRHH